MSDKTSAEVVAKMQRELDKAEMAMFHLCHLNADVRFKVRRRDGESIFCVSVAGVDDEVGDKDPLVALGRAAGAAFNSHMGRWEERSNAQR